ncbi:DNA topoisomerase I [archaeon]|nr:DNA topoisomerase I [archaeon]
MVELIITEKPMAALKIATALGDHKPIKHTKGKSVYYEITRNKKRIYVGCAVGHLFGLGEKVKTKWKDYPSFDISWIPKYELMKTADYTKSYLTILKTLGKKVDTIIVATDYDIEGAVIGYTIVKYGLGKNTAKRMKYSTLTQDELIDSYKHLKKTQDKGMVEAGITRHHLDWFYGINLTKALTMAIRNAHGYFQVLSTGRVQGPALNIVVKKEKEIKKFKPEKYWEIYLDGKYKKTKILAKHKSDKFIDKKKVSAILRKTKGKEAIVDKVTKKVSNQAPPTPFDLTTLQTEAFRHLGSSPKQTSQLAQQLYISGLISYPRTSSQKLPPSINYKKILKQLETQTKYKKECATLLSKSNLKPSEGKKSDPAHPAIYPTGEKAKTSGKKAELYDLIVRRFLAVFGEPAKRETMSVDINVNKEIFHLTGTITLNPGWHTLYGRFAKVKEEELPDMQEKEKINVKKIFDEEKETQPPKRYTQASIIRELEKQGLGTKATRAIILDTLLKRGYIEDKPVKATELGIKLISTLKKYSPEIIDEHLTREFEEAMKQIREGKVNKKTVIEGAKKVLTKTLKGFKENEKNIGKGLSLASRHTHQEANKLGSCQVCKKGTLRIMYSKVGKKRFVACDQYPKCKTTYSLPQQGMIKSTDKPCKHDGFPQVMVIRQGKRPWILCLNPDCPGKAEWAKKKEEKAKKKSK